MEKTVDAYLSLGTNLGNRINYLQKALELLNNRGCSVVNVSPVYESTPIGFSSEDLFLNVAVLIRTRYTPFELLQILKGIENDLGRTKKSTKHYESRVIDLDIIFYGTSRIQSEELTVPHPLYHERLFVLLPLLDIDPNLCDPATRKLIKEYINPILPQQIISKTSILLIH